MKSIKTWLFATVLAIALTIPALAADTDGDGLDDLVETNTGIYNGPLDTGTDPLNPDTDGDGVLDGPEVTSGSHPLDPLIAPTIGKIGPDVRITNNISASYAPSLVWTSSEFSVSWNDAPTGSPGIYFNRIDATGNIIGPEVRVSELASASNNPSMTWTGSEYGVSWQDRRDGGDDELYFTRADATGSRIGTDLRVTNFNWWSYEPSIVWTGTEFSICWHDYRNNDQAGEIYFARFDSSGNKIGADMAITVYDAIQSVNASLVWTGSEYGVSWWDYRDGNWEIYFARIDTSGNKIGGDVRITNDTSQSSSPSLVWMGTEYGVSWVDNRSGNFELYFALINASGIKTTGDLRITNTIAESYNPSMVWTGSQYGVSWWDNRDGDWEIYFVSLTEVGVKIRPELRVTNSVGDSRMPSMVWTGSEFGVSWEEYRDGNAEIYFTRIAVDTDGDGLSNSYEQSTGTNANYWDSDGDGLSDGVETNTGTYNGALDTGTDPNDPDTDGDTVPDGQEVTGGAHPLDPLIFPSSWKIGSDVRITNDLAVSEYPSLVWTGTEYGICWTEGRDGGPEETYFARIDSNGTKVGSDVRITSSSGVSHWPSLVWAGTEYGVSWHDTRDGNDEIYFARIDSTGNKIGGDVRITNDLGRSAFVSLIWTGTEFGVSWFDDRDGQYEVYFARIDASGNKIGSDARITNTPSNVILGFRGPSLSWNGVEFGVSWDDLRDGNEEIYFTRISSAGVKIGSDIRITNDPNQSNYPSLVWNGVEYGLSWRDNRDGNGEIYFTRINSTGVKIGADIRLTFASGSSEISSLVWTGTGYGVTWVDARDGNNEIYFARTDVSGNKIGSDLRITNNIASSAFPSMVWASTNFGVCWYDNADGNLEIYFARIALDDDGDWLSNAFEASIGTNPNNWDTDGDGISDLHETWDANTDPTVWDPQGGPGPFHHGDVDGDGVVTLADTIAARDGAILKPVDCSQVYPSNCETLDIDNDDTISLPDVNILRDWEVCKSTAVANPGLPATITITSPADGSVLALGDTVEVVVEVRSQNGRLRTGMGVMFEVLSGTATLFGGRGNGAMEIDPDTGTFYQDGSRWSMTGAKADGATAKITIRRDAPGPIVLRARVPKSPCKQVPSSISATLTLN